jgi:opacity protein-like surface antigen
MKWLGAALLCLIVVGFATPAAAQDTPKVEISGGYNFFSGKASGDEDWEKFPKGWYADIAGNVTETIGIVGQVTGNYKTIEDSDGDFDLKIHTYMFGVRGSSPGRVRGFGQVLVGAANLKGSVPGFSATQTNLAFQVGGGVTVLNTGNVGFRAGVDYLRIKGKDDGEVLGDDSVNGFRFNVGVVIGF